jgi:hypothetical protein
MSDFEDSNSPKWDNQIQPARSTSTRPSAANCRVKNEAGKEYTLNDKIATLQVRPARLAPRRKACTDRRPARVRRHFRFRPVPLPQRQGTDRPRRRALSSTAENGKPPRSAPVERHLRHGAKRDRPAARHDQGDGADRDHPRHLRTRRDPVRTARTQRGPQRRTLGLHLLLHQGSSATRISASPTAAPSPWKCPSCAATHWRWSRPATSAAPRPWAA